MSVSDRAADATAAPTVNPTLKLRSSTDRTCPACGEVALAFAVADGQARCRACGSLD
jgi:uncharacterized protein (DUF983 family)